MLCNGIAAMRCDTTIQQANDKFVVKFFFFLRQFLSLTLSLLYFPLPIASMQYSGPTWNWNDCTIIKAIAIA